MKSCVVDAQANAGKCHSCVEPYSLDYSTGQCV